MQEEFDRFTGYYWDSSASGKTSRIVFAEIDETHLRVFKIPEPGIEGNVDDFTYPMAGDENARFDIAIAEFDTSDVRYYDICCDPISILHAGAPGRCSSPSHLQPSRDSSQP
jgi:hypothetical protein